VKEGKFAMQIMEKGGKLAAIPSKPRLLRMPPRPDGLGCRRVLCMYYGSV
jgi:hypothetical protein